MLNKKALAASVSAGPAPFVEDVFSTYLYTGTGATLPINNGIDLAGEGGLVWCKGRNEAFFHSLVDSTRGISKWLGSNTGSAQDTFTDAITSFNNNGFTLGADTQGGYVNASTYNFVSWTFRKQPKFFDVVTWSGNSTAGRTISHSLGSVPGMIIVKRTDTTGNWQVYHRANTANPETDYLVLNSTAATADSDTRWNDTLPTSTVFSLGTDATVNASGGTYVAYLFAHDAGGFGTAGTDNVISCGSFSGNTVVNLGYEPQYILVKPTNISFGWWIIDNMRGMTASDTLRILEAQSSSAEYGSSGIKINATGFESTGFGGANVIYMAIRRPMKVPTTGTEVFSPNYQNVSTGTAITTNFPPDLQLYRSTAQVANEGVVVDRLRGVNTTTTANSTPWLDTTTTAAEATASSVTRNWGNTGFEMPGFVATIPSVFYSFSRRPGFMDVVCYTGTGSTRTVAHNLGVAPELMIVKRRDTAANWICYNSPKGATEYLLLNSNQESFVGTFWNDTTPTSTVFSLGTGTPVNASGGTFVAYLFATCAGVSKVGSYTGTGTTQVINCGFTTGSRFVLIKRTDSTGDWYVWDTARGIISGNDPYLLLNSTAAEVTNTDYIDPVSSGFELSSTAPAAINASGGTFIFLAVS